MKRFYFSILELAFLALALTFLVPTPQSVPGPYHHDYYPEVLFVAGAMAISRFFSYKNGRNAIVCSLEVLIVAAAFVVHQLALSYVVGKA